MTAEDEKTCFIAMPITTHDREAELYGGDAEHWVHVMETIFVPAVEQAGFKALRPQAVGSDMIHGHIVRALETSDMVLCDLSGHNPNVFFELGVRTSLNKPVVLVKDEHLGFPFDTGVLNTHSYSSALSGWEIASEVDRLAQHIRASERTCAGRNPMWRHFGLTMAAEKPASEDTSASDAKLELMFESVQELRREFASIRDASPLGAGVSAEKFGVAPRSVRWMAEKLGPLFNGPSNHVGRGTKAGEYVISFHRPPEFEVTGELMTLATSVAAARSYRVAGITERGDSLGVIVIPSEERD